MIQFVIDGKDLSNEDLNILICKDNAKNETELKMFCDKGEITVNDSDAVINVSIEILSNKKLCDEYQERKDVKVSIASVL